MKNTKTKFKLRVNFTDRVKALIDSMLSPVLTNFVLIRAPALKSLKRSTPCSTGTNGPRSATRISMILRPPTRKSTSICVDGSNVDGPFRSFSHQNESHSTATTGSIRVRKVPWHRRYQTRPAFPCSRSDGESISPFIASQPRCAGLLVAKRLASKIWPTA